MVWRDLTQSGLNISIAQKSSHSCLIFSTTCALLSLAEVSREVVLDAALMPEAFMVLK